MIIQYKNKKARAADALRRKRQKKSGTLPPKSRKRIQTYMKVAICTLGCKVNQYETQALEQELLHRGHTLVDFEETADAYVVNTCSVTAVSDKKSRQMIRKLREARMLDKRQELIAKTPAAATPRRIPRTSKSSGSTSSPARMTARSSSTFWSARHRTKRLLSMSTTSGSGAILRCCPRAVW